MKEEVSKKYILIPPVLFAAFFIVASCSSQQKATQPYSEDLTVNRPQFEDKELKTAGSRPDTDRVTFAPVKPTKNVNKKVDAVLDSIDRINLTKKYVDGFTIQIYSGQHREEALNIKQRMKTEADDLPCTLQYIQPKFRVAVGNYITRMEAQKDFIRMKHHFPAAILVPEKILIK